MKRFRSTPLPPYERGLELGERLRPEVTESAAAYRRLFATRAEVPFDVDLWSDRAWVTIQRLAPVAAEEIAGIAEGARRPVREIAAINARTELLAVANPSGRVSECSAVVGLPPGRPPVAVQTWDWYHAMSEHWMHWSIPHPDGRTVETVTEFGMLAKIGVNGYGVGVLLNMLHHVNDQPTEDVADDDRLGYPVHLASRRILDEATGFDDAVAIATTGPSSASTSLTVVTEWAAASIELFPGGHGAVEPDDGVLVRTNHFVSSAGAPGCTASEIGPGSWLRRDKLIDSFTDRVPASTSEVVDAMHDHAEIGGICAHPDTSTDPMIWHATLATVAIDTVGRSLDVTVGGPCAADRFREVPA